MKYILYFGLLIITLFTFSCQKEEVDNKLFPDAGNSFLDIENDGYFVELNAQDASEGQEGIWRVYRGTNGMFDNEKDSQTKFYGEPGEIYLLGWELSSGKEYKSSTINVSFKPLNPVIQNEEKEVIKDNISLLLKSDKAKFGAEGYWEIIDGENGRITNADSCSTPFIGTHGSKYKVRWTLTYGSKEVYTELKINTDTLRAFAGKDNLDIITSGKEEDIRYQNLNAYLPAGAVGNWEIIGGEGGKIYHENKSTSLFEGRADSTYTFLWHVSINEYESIDTLKLRFRGKYGVWVDSRDKQEYRYVKVDNLEWMSENLNYSSPWSQYGKNWYYGQTSRADIVDGVAVDTEEQRKLYGRIYNHVGALDAVPEEGGWRLPTKKEYEELEVSLGGPHYYFDRVVKGGDSGVDIIFGGSIYYANNNNDYRDRFTGQGTQAFYMTSDFEKESYRVGVYIYTSSRSSSGASLSFATTGGSVRLVREVNEN